MSEVASVLRFLAETGNTLPRLVGISWAGTDQEILIKLGKVLPVSAKNLRIEALRDFRSVTFSDF